MKRFIIELTSCASGLISFALTMYFGGFICLPLLLEILGAPLFYFCLVVAFVTSSILPDYMQKLAKRTRVAHCTLRCKACGWHKNIEFYVDGFDNPKKTLSKIKKHGCKNCGNPKLSETQLIINDDMFEQRRWPDLDVHTKETIIVSFITGAIILSCFSFVLLKIFHFFTKN